MAMRTGELDVPLMQLSPQGDFWDLRTALTHTLVLGTTGSGKSSSTMKHAIKSMLRLGAGGLFCIAKKEDADDIIRYCHETGRAPSLIDWTGTNGGYNFLAHELARSGNINNVIDVLMAVLDISRNSGSSGGKSGEQFWIDAAKQMLTATIPIIFAATGTVRIVDILAFIRSAPSSLEQMADPEWQRSAPFARFFLAAAERSAKMAIRGFDDEVGQRATAYWREMARLDAKTAGNIRISVTSALSRFEQGWLRDAFCGESSIFPETMLSGALIVMNFPVQTHGEDAAIAQKLFKFMAQRVLLARNGMAPHLRSRPVMIVADECQNFLHTDADFLSQCRSSRVAVLMATQSLPTLYAKIGGDHPHDRAEHFASNFGVIVMHSSACPVSNEWLSRKIGRRLHARANFSASEGFNDSYGMNLGEGENHGTQGGSGGSSGTSHGPGGSSSNSGSSWNRGWSSGDNRNWSRNRGGGSNHGTSHGYSMTMDHTIEPGFFASGLKTGGPANGNRVSAVWYQAGRVFRASGNNALLVEFQQ